MRPSALPEGRGQGRGAGVRGVGVGEGQPEDEATRRGFGVVTVPTTNTHRSQPEEQWVYTELTTLPGCIKPNSPDMCWVDSEMVGNWRGTGLFRLPVVNLNR